MKIVRQNPRWGSIYYLCRDNNRFPFEVKSPFDLDVVQTRLLDIARFYDILYALGEEIPDSILDSLPKARRWYKAYSDEKREEIRKSKKANQNPYDRKSSGGMTYLASEDEDDDVYEFL